MNIMLHFGFATATAAILVVGGCTSDGAHLPALAESSTLDDSYVLGAGDRLQIELYDMNTGVERPGPAGNGADQFVVSENGTIEAPLIGSLPAAGLTVDQLKREIIAKLSEGYLKDPKIGVTMVTYRPFYIVGEVNHPGSYPCTARSRTVSAVALAGGYTYRANEEFAIIERRQGDKIVTGRAGPDTTILPDDVIRITQRYF
ncbi:MAG: polysaccharide biosynthesis [Rhodospirillales bacterium]|nr:polysaccharide biosynthesis [Rhodospirillales bacterium]